MVPYFGVRRAEQLRCTTAITEGIAYGDKDGEYALKNAKFHSRADLKWQTSHKSAWSEHEASILPRLKTQSHSCHIFCFCANQETLALADPTVNADNLMEKRGLRACS